MLIYVLVNNYVASNISKGRWIYIPLIASLSEGIMHVNNPVFLNTDHGVWPSEDIQTQRYFSISKFGSFLDDFILRIFLANRFLLAHQVNVFGSFLTGKIFSRL